MAARSPDVRVKRVYDEASAGDGARVLVDRLWPRGIYKAAARIDHWFRDVAPSTALRQWYGHDPAKWPEFQRRYRAELANVPEPLAELRALVAAGRVTLLFSSRELERNNAMALQTVLRAARPTASRSRAKAR